MPVRGAGVVGTNATRMNLGPSAVVDKNVDRLCQIDLIFSNRITTACSHAQRIEDASLDGDAAVAGGLIFGALGCNTKYAASPTLLTSVVRRQTLFRDHRRHAVECRFSARRG